MVVALFKTILWVNAILDQVGRSPEMKDNMKNFCVRTEIREIQPGLNEM